MKNCVLLPFSFGFHEKLGDEDKFSLDYDDMNAVKSYDKKS